MDISYKNKNIKFNFRTSVIIENENGDKVLLQQSDNDSNYRLMGGKVMFFESTLEGIQREFKEELGYDIPKEQFRLLLITENMFDYMDNEGQIQKVHGLDFVYKLIINNDHELSKKDKFHDLEKNNVTFCWKEKEELRDKSIVPSIVKSLIYETEDGIKYEVNDERMYL